MTFEKGFILLIFGAIIGASVMWLVTARDTAALRREAAAVHLQYLDLDSAFHVAETVAAARADTVASLRDRLATLGVQRITVVAHTDSVIRTVLDTAKITALTSAVAAERRIADSVATAHAQMVAILTVQLAEKDTLLVRYRALAHRADSSLTAAARSRSGRFSVGPMVGVTLDHGKPIIGLGIGLRI